MKVANNHSPKTWGDSNWQPAVPAHLTWYAYSWYDANADKETHPVGEREPHSFPGSDGQFYDWLGNVREYLATGWCPEFWDKPSGLGLFEILLKSHFLGGGPASDEPYCANPDNRAHTVGFDYTMAQPFTLVFVQEKTKATASIGFRLVRVRNSTALVPSTGAASNSTENSTSKANDTFVGHEEL